MKKAFTLIEMLLVIAIVALIIGLASPFIFGSLQSTRLTSSGENLLNRMAQVQQLAASGNYTVQIRFYRYEGGVRAYQFIRTANDRMTAGTSTNPQYTAMGEPYYLDSGIVIADDPTHSPLVAGQTLTPPTSEKFFPKEGATYAALEISPDGIVRQLSGSSGLPVNVNFADSYITLIPEELAGVAGASLTNFYTVQIDPYSAKPRSFRAQVQ